LSSATRAPSRRSYTDKSLLLVVVHSLDFHVIIDPGLSICNQQNGAETVKKQHEASESVNLTSVFQLILLDRLTSWFTGPYW
jgi:hypothetical protein